MGMTYSDIKKRVREGTYDGGDTTPKRKTYAEIKASLSDYDFGIGDDYIKEFAKEVAGYYSGIKDDFSQIGYSNASKLYDSYLSRSSALREKAGNIKAYLNANKSKIDEKSYNELMSFVDDFDTTSSKTLSVLNNAKNYYSQWDTEDAYNTSKRLAEYNAEYKDYSYNDIQNELKKLAQERAEAQARSDDTKPYDQKIGWIENYAITKPYELSEYDSVLSDISQRMQQLQDKLEQKRAEYAEIAESGDLSSVERENALRIAYDELENIRKEYEKEYAKLERDFNVLSAARNLKQREAELNAKYGDLPNRPDFTAKSVYVTTNPEHKTYGSTFDTSIDWTYEYINDPEVSATAGKQAGMAGTVARYDYLYYIKPEEKQIYNYLYSTQGKESAEAYLRDIRDILEKRAEDQHRERWTSLYNDADWLGKVFMNAATVPASVAGNISSFIDDVSSGITEGTIHPYSAAHAPQQFAQHTRQLTTEEIQNRIKDKRLGALVANTYQAIMSGADSMANIALFGELASIPMAMGAASLKARELYERGASKEQIFEGALVSGAIELITETYSVEKFFSNKDLSFWKRILSQALAEGSEEVSSEMLNMAAESIIQGYNSIDENEVRRLIVEGGLSEEEARKQVALGNALDIWWSFYGGAVSGASMIGLEYGARAGAYTYNQIRNTINARNQSGAAINENANIDALIASARDLPDSSANAKIKALAEEVARTNIENLTAKGQKAFDKKVGKLYEQVQKAQAKAYFGSDTETKRDIIAEKLKANGATNESDIKLAASGILKILNGDKQNQLTNAESEAIERVGGLKVANELLNNSAELAAKSEAAQERALTKLMETSRLTNAKATDQKRSIDTSDYSVSDDGKTYVKETGEAVEITDIKSIKNGNVIVTLSNGKTANIKDLDLGSKNDAILYAGISEMGIDAASARMIVKSFDPNSGISAESFILGARDAIKYGRIGAKAFLDSGVFTSMLPESQRKAFYRVGEMQAESETAKRTEEIKSGKATSKAKGKVTFEGVSEANLNGRQRVSVNTARLIAGIFKVDVVLFQSPTNEKGQHIGENGSYDPNTDTIRIDINAGVQGNDAMLFTMAHELTHYINKWSPTEYKVFADFLVEQYAKHGVSIDYLIEQKQQEYRRANPKAKPLTYEQAYDEVVADSCESFLRDSKILDKLVLLAKQDMTLFEKIKDFIDNLLTDINKYYGALRPDSREANIVLGMKDVITDLHDKWEQAALSAAGKSSAYSSKSATSKAETSIKFQMRDTVEETKDLIAIHNLSEKNLLDALELGGFAMPSIAIIRPDMTHDKYGDISVVFGKETINPTDRRNKVYSGDAWTPTFPEIGYKLNEKKSDEIITKINSLLESRGIGSNMFGYLALDSNNMEDYLRRGDGDVIPYYRDEVGIKAAYLIDKGIDFDIPNKIDMRADEGEIKYLIDKLGEDRIREIMKHSAPEITEEIRSILNEYWNTVDFKNERLSDSIKKYGYYKQQYFGFAKADSFINDAYNYLNQKKVVDETALKENINALIEKNQSDYDKWLKKLFAGIVEKRGIRNERDFFTSSGNRRSWDALYNEITLENVVNAMLRQEQKGVGWGYSIFGAATKEYKSIAEMKEDYARLSHMDDEQYENLRNEYANRLAEICERLRDKRESNIFIALDRANEAIIDALQHTSTKAGIKKVLNQYTGLNVTDEIVDDIVDLVNDIAKMPTQYFEAKPRRAVGFDEVKAAVIPSDASAELKEGLQKENINTIEYERGNKEDRIRALNSIDDVKFSIRYTTDNKAVVVIDENILLGVPKKQWVKTVKRTISEKFSGGIPISGRLIKVNAYTRNEFTHSRYTKYLRTSDGTIYADKFKSANNLDEIILASTNYINEDLKHERKDNIKEFARGDVLIRVENNDYSAKVIVGLTSGNQMVLYDIVDIKPANFKLKKEDNSIDFGTNRSLRNESSSDTNVSQNDTSVNTQYMQKSEKDSENFRYSQRVTDKETLDFLNEQLKKGEVVEVYRAMQVVKVNGEDVLVPPMAGKVKVNGQWVWQNPSRLNQWEQSTEITDFKAAVADGRLIPTKYSDGRDGYKFKLKKGQSGMTDVPAAYNPYIHTSLSALNDQFTSAYKRPNLRIVKGYVPKSELTSGYRANYAKDTVGKTHWHSGVVAGKMPDTREVILSRYFMPTEVLDDKVVAKLIKQQMQGRDITVPYNVVSPSLRRALENEGVMIGEGEGLTNLPPKDSVKYSLRTDSEGNELSDEQVEFFKDSKVRDAEGRLLKVYHGTRKADFTVFKRNVNFFTDNKEMAGSYAPNSEIYEGYLNIAKPYIIDAQNEKWSRIPIDNETKEMLDNYGSSTFKENGKWRTTPADIVAAISDGIDEGELDYDGVIILNVDDTGSYWKGKDKHSANDYIVFNSNQFKNADNLSPTSDPDIRYQQRSDIKDRDKVLAQISKENEILKQSVSDLKELVKLQRKLTYGKVLSKSSVEAVAKRIMKYADAKGDVKALSDMLYSVYDYIIQGQDVSWEGIKEKAQDAVNWLQENRVQRNEIDEYSKQILSHLKSLNVYLDEQQKQEAAYAYGSYGEYRKRLFGSINLTTEGNGLPLDSAWQELAEMYPAYFSADISSNDQPIALYEAIQGLRDTRYSYSEYEYSADMDAQDLLTEIYDGYWDVSTLHTAADAKQKEINKLRAKHRQRISNLREQHMAFNDRMKKEYQQKLKEFRKKYREKSLEKQRKIIEQYQEARKKNIEKRHEAEKIKKYRDRIMSDVDELSKWVLKPDNKNVLKRVPDALKNTVIPFLTSIDFTSKQQLRGGEATKADAEFVGRLNALKNAIKTNIDINGMYSGYNDLPPDFMEDLQNFIDKTQELVNQKRGEFVINRMTGAELEELSKIVRALKKLITDMNRFHANAVFQHVYEAGSNTFHALKGMRDAGKSVGKISNYLLWQNIRPAYAFERFGEGGKAIYDEFRRAQATLAFNAKKIIDFAREAYTDAEVEAWEKEYKVFKLGGDEVRIPVSFIMSFYELSKQPDSLRHILSGGIRVATYKEGKYTVSDTGHVLTERDVSTIVGSLTDRQKEVADRLQKYMATQGAAWGNYVSLKRFGEELFNIPQYFPINSDGRHLESTAEEHPSNASLYALLNMSFTKQRNEKANNRIVLYSIFDVFANHMASMAQYNAFALPILDALKWFNYKETKVDGKGNTFVVGNIREEMARVYGVPEENRPGKGKEGYAETFIKNIIRAYNGTETQGIPTDEIGLKELRRYNMAQIAFNFRVFIQQPLAITRAGLLIDYRSILKGLKLSPSKIKANIEEMYKYSGIAGWKSLGFYDINISRGLTEIIKHNKSTFDKISEIGMLGAEKADEMTWAAIWSACKEEVSRKQKNLKVGSNEYYEAVTNLFEDVIYKTQVVDSVLTKTEFMRSKGFVGRALSSFMSEPVTTASMVLDAYSKYSIDMQNGLSRQQAWNKNKNLIVRTAAVYGISATLLAAVQAVIDAFRDDDDETWLEKYVEAFTGNVFDELVPFNKLPILSDFYDLAKQLLSIFGVDTYGNPPQSVIMQWYDSLIKGTQILYDKISGESTGYTWYAGIAKILQAISGMTGLPIAASVREVITAWNNTVGALSPRLKIETYVSSAEKRNRIFKAMQNSDVNGLDYLRSEFTSDESFERAKKESIKERYIAGKIDYGTAATYLVSYCGQTFAEAEKQIKKWDESKNK